MPESKQKTPIAQIHEAVNADPVDHEKVVHVLSSHNFDERQGIAEWYEEEYGKDLFGTLKQKLPANILPVIAELLK